jgi:tRNA pseudouridine38-40 synthase
MSRYCITIAYDGQPFSGWQSQPGQPTVQATLEAALAAVAGPRADQRPHRVHGSGRTDAGVHATGQVAHFDAPEGVSLDGSAWRRALNAHLPSTVRIMACRCVADTFHARFDARRKTYAYRIHHADVLPPHEADRAWHLFGALDQAVLETGLAALIGRHDFTAFAVNRGDASDAGSRERMIHDAWLTVDGPRLTLRFTGDGFLYKMARLLTGGLVRCARGRASLDWYIGLLRDPNQGQKCCFCAPGAGLFLERVTYSD